MDPLPLQPNGSNVSIQPSLSSSASQPFKAESLRATVVSLGDPGAVIGAASVFVV